MIVLGIDTSCDDTCVAVLEVRGSRFEVRSNIVSSQIKIHKRYGGVFPTLAKREHKRNLPLVFKKALKEAGFQIPNSKWGPAKGWEGGGWVGVQIPKIDLISVTVGPGLGPCLWIGVNFAKDLAKKLDVPIVPVNHIEAHILINFVGENSKWGPAKGWEGGGRVGVQIPNSKIFPAICLVVSGGHTQLILMEKIGKYKLIGETRDDAAGECLDKVARLLGLGYPGGPAIDKISKLQIPNSKLKVNFPRPMIKQKNYDFSFAGLKTAVLYDFLKRPERVRKSREYKILVAKEVQQAVIDVLISKTLRAAKEFGAKSIILGGGVVANEELRKQFIENSKHQIPNSKLLMPPKELCTDNGLMVAVAGYFNKEKATKDFDKIVAEPNLKI
jgi:N6-L-threonylcarbamoyladenine synthase